MEHIRARLLQLLTLIKKSNPRATTLKGIAQAIDILRDT